jgi:Conjugative transposon, TraM
MIMQKKILSARQIRESQFLLRAPLLAIPLLTLLVWGLGLGKNWRISMLMAKGFDMRLPVAHVPVITKLDKMGYYDLAKRDSVSERQKEKIEESYAKKIGLDSTGDATVLAIRKKLQELKTTMVVAASPHGLTPPNFAAAARPPVPSIPIFQQRDPVANSEIQGLTTVLDKLVSLQRPAKDSAQHSNQRHTSHDGLPVRAIPEPDDSLPGFDSTTIEVILPERQTLVGGQSLRMELLRAVLIGRDRIPAGTTLSCETNLAGERLKLHIISIGFGEKLYPVSLQAYDQDGIAGIYIPGAPTSEAVRESAGQDLGAIDPTIVTTTAAGQAATAGLNFTRTLIGKKIRPVKVTIPAGYHLFLHPENHEQ